ncbi:MAG: hypothetical protein ACRBBW_20555 [Cellvibrionaceae bacterium]
MGSSKTPKQEVSEQEKLQSQQAAKQWNERIDDGYIQLEQDAIADAQLDHSGQISGQASGDVAVAEAEGLRSQIRAGGPNSRGLSSIGDAVNTAVTTADVDSKSSAQTLKDTKMVGISKLGTDVALGASGALKTSAGLGASRALTEVNNKILVNNSKTAAMMTAAEGLGTGYMMKAQGYSIGKNGLTVPGKTQGLRDEGPTSSGQKNGGRSE